MDRTQREKDGERKQPDDEAVHLRREINLLSATAIIFGGVVGSGIFIAPKGVLMNSGSVGLSLLVWALSGILSMFGALCYAELGTSFTKSGGHYTYLLETLGPLPAFLRLWAEFMFLRPATVSYLSLAFGHYVMEPFFEPCTPPTVLVKLIGALALTLVVAVNCWSVTMATRTQVLLAFIKMFALVLIIIPGVIALAKGKTENFQNGFELDLITWDKLPLAFFNGLYAFYGWSSLNSVREEVKNPNRTFPLVIISSMVAVTVCYVLVNMAYYTMMTPAELLQSETVASTFANRSLHGMASVIPVLVALSCLGTLTVNLFGSPRMMFVGARDGHFPSIFSMIHIRRKTPLPAVLLMYPLTLLFLASGEIYQLINFVAFTSWLFVALATTGMLIHRYRFPLHPRPFKAPVVIAVTFTLVCFFIVGLSLYSDPWNTGWSCALTLTGVPFYYLTVKRFCLPARWRRAFNSCSKKLQIFLEVVQQEIKTY
ncbi:cystine/glutamate transporter-like [Brachionichthys hirsutus]|uniref:cystine/glutamate transporter-like n=1 Tax=Brachionichthys hirsutus TaxID=412623 RepID=UPI00360473FC